LYLAGSCVGERIGEHYVCGRESKINALLLKIGLIAWGVTALAVAVRLLLPVSESPMYEVTIHHLLSPFQKLPPSPIYFLFYGGAGALVLYSLFRFGKTRPVKRYMGFAEVLGQTSLFVFIFQYYVYFTFFSEASLSFSSYWPLYFIASVAVISLASSFWHKRNYNRFLKVPYLTFTKQKQATFRDNESRV
jgi:hypothetical protein